MSFPAYPVYKDSEVTWIGDVPTSWAVKPFKWLLSNNDGGVWGDDPSGEGDTLVLRSTDQTVDGNWKLIDPAPRKLSDKEKASALLVQGDLVVTKSSGSSLHIGKTTLVTAAIAKQGCCYGNFMQRLRVNSSFTPKLAWYVMNNELARAQLDLLSNSTTGLANLNGTLIGEILLPISTVSEQTQITRFLDHETARIDALIEEQHRLIELLKEKRQAVISQAVTKGLDLTVPMKDSCVEWLGEVPVHWAVSPLKFLIEEKVAGPYGASLTKAMYTNSGYRVYGQQQVISDDFSIGDYYISEEKFCEMQRYVVFPGDVLISVMGTIGRVSVVPVGVEVGIINPRLVRYKFASDKVVPEFVKILLMSLRYQSRLSEESQGSTMEGLNMVILGDLPLVLPPLDVQHPIVAFVKNYDSNFNGLVSQATWTVDLLQERRSALISAAVTGKIDVRGWQPPASAASPELAKEVV